MTELLRHSRVARWLPERPRDGHKGTFGHLFVLAGSRGLSGAARLACEAAYRTGAGLVTLGVPKPLANALEAALLETMTLSLPATDMETLSSSALAHALAFANGRQAAVVGPGLSRHADTALLAREMALRCAVPTVLDADALYALCREEPFDGFPETGDGGESDASTRVMTPHPGEMSRLTGMAVADIQADREGTAAQFAEKWRAVVVLKGRHTVIAAPDGRLAVNPTGNQGMATGGTGDVLAGMIGALLAQGTDTWGAACAGVYAHGLAGDIAARRMTPRALVAGDLLAALPEAWRELEG
ncbi:MAG: NAD(P)H-hydrate dehydratase [Candidatus Hydrogenedens sp.]|nr:NAD(P)H-hydrate dehydratase [Candidatus Hydrogenedentota bacterium]NLF56169.1 NAD(P)H-hydrate dehydratase [Candidatus Hydrogenedens sp.]